MLLSAAGLRRVFARQHISDQKCQFRFNQMPDYYHNNYKQFFDQTVDIDPSLFLSSFVNIIPSKISILDVGSGSGRDLLWLKNQGFNVTGFEREL